MLKRKIIAVAVYCCFATCLFAQEPQRFDADLLIKKITIIPPTVEELHSVFTRQTKYGEETRNELITLVYEEIKSLVKTIHNNTILKIMQTSRREDMTDSVQYEDERWKLAVRPLLGADVKAKLLKTETSARPIVIQIFEMQHIFDFVKYYQEETKIKKEFAEKVSGITGETSTAIAKGKLQLDIQQYKKQQQLWIGRYHKYTKGLLLLQQLLDKINYGETLPAEDSKIIIPVLADVQARALESIEKLIWNEESIVISGELAYNGERILNMYTE